MNERKELTELQKLRAIIEKGDPKGIGEELLLRLQALEMNMVRRMEIVENDLICVNATLNFFLDDNFDTSGDDNDNNETPTTPETRSIIHMPTSKIAHEPAKVDILFLDFSDSVRHAEETKVTPKKRRNKNE